MNHHQTQAGLGTRTRLTAGTYPKRTSAGCYNDRNDMLNWCSQHKMPQTNLKLPECAGNNIERLLFNCLHDNQVAGWWKNFSAKPECTGEQECYNSRPALTRVEGSAAYLLSPWVKDVPLE
jgi:hypothetical protein